MEAADRLFARCGEMQERLLYIFRKEQDYFVRLNWHDEVLFPQEAVQDNLRALYKALRHAWEGNARAALEDIYGIDNNRYAFLFDEQVFNYFTQYAVSYTHLDVYKRKEQPSGGDSACGLVSISGVHHGEIF